MTFLFQSNVLNYYKEHVPMRERKVSFGGGGKRRGGGIKMEETEGMGVGDFVQNV